MSSLKSVIESRRFEVAIMVLVVINAITLGLETIPSVMERIGPALIALDQLILAVFTVELLIKFAVYRLNFFRDPWRVFDFIVVTIALLPATGPLSVLRALRILRVLRLISIVPSLRRVVGGLVAALPGMGSIMLLLGLVFYVFSVMATELYGETFPDRFGNLAMSAYTLFQVMTLEGWSDGVVRPVMEVHPFAWLFFIPFIVATSFAVLNLFIGIIVSAMQEEEEASAANDREELQAGQDRLLEEIRGLRQEVARLTEKRTSA